MAIERLDPRRLASRLRRARDEAEVIWRGAALIGLLVLAGVLGLLAAFKLSPSAPGWGSAAEEEIVETVTVKQVVTVGQSRGRTRVVVKQVPLVRTITAPGAGSGAERVVTERRTVPVVKKDLVTVASPARTVVTVRNRPVTRVVTNERVVTAVRTETQTVPVTQTVRTTATIVLTQTVTHPVTVTAPAVNVTVTVPRVLP